MATVTTDTQDPRPYPLGYTETEFTRLERQAAFFGDQAQSLYNISITRYSLMKLFYNTHVRV
jgi:hypothetical protein